MWNRRDWVRWCASAACLAGTTSAHSQQGASGSRALPRKPALAGAPWVIAVDDLSAFCQLPLSVCDHMDFFAQEGVHVKVREYPDAAQALQAVLTGGAHVLAAGYSQNIALQLRGQWFQSFVVQGRTPQLVLGVSPRTLPGSRQLADLKGRRVGVVALGSASHRVARLALAQARLGPDDVDFMALPSPSGAVAAVRSGRVDAICYTDPVITELEQGGDLRVLVDTRTVRGNAELFGGPLPAACLSAPVHWVEQNPRVAQAMASTVVRGLKWLQTAGPSDIIKAVPETHFRGDRARYLAAFSRAREAWTPDGLMPTQGPANAVRMLSKFMDTPSLQGLDLARTFTNEFAQIAKARFRA